LTIAFVPFASVDNTYQQYTAMVQQALSHLPHHIETVTNENATITLKSANVIMVGGGNTFKLLHDLYELSVLDLIREKVSTGTPYIGWSAGANITGLTIGTTNDMPIIQPQSFKALGFLPFQINPHYINQVPEGFHGETRDQRLEEFIKMNTGIPVVGLPEGTALKLEENKLCYIGTTKAVYFKMDAGKIFRNEIADKEDLSFLLL
jgi:dipeptidase E